MPDYPESVRIANRLEAINQLRDTANILVPFLQKRFNQTRPIRLANDSGWYKATEASLSEARELIPYPKVTMRLDQTRYFTYLRLDTNYSVAEWGVNYVNQHFLLIQEDMMAQWHHVTPFTAEEITSAEELIRDAVVKIEQLTSEISIIKQTYYPFFPS